MDSVDVARIERRAGFTLLEVLLSLAALSLLVILLVDFSQFSTAFQGLSSSITTQEKLRVIRNAVIQAAKDVNNDGYYDVYASGTGGSVPSALNLGAYSKDEFGTSILYCPYNIGTTNVVDPAYASNSPAYSSDHATAMIVSAGKDRIFQTTCASNAAQGDDIAVFAAEADIRQAKGGLGGFKHGGGEISPVTATDNINLQNSLLTTGAFNVLPATDPSGAAIKVGTIAYQGVDQNMYVYTESGWRPMKCPAGQYTRADGSCGALSEVQCPAGTYVRANGTCGPLSEVSGPNCAPGQCVKSNGTCGTIAVHNYSTVMLNYGPPICNTPTQFLEVNTYRGTVYYGTSNVSYWSSWGGYTMNCIGSAIMTEVVECQ